METIERTNEKAITLSTQVETMIDARKWVGLAVSDDKSRPVLNGMAHELVTAETAILVATDTHRLHICNIAPSDSPAKEIGVTVCEAGGVFPNWERVTPKLSCRDCLVTAQDLDIALRSVAIVAKESANRVRLTFSGKSLTVRAKSDNGIMVEATIGISETENVEGFQIAFNYQYLLDAISMYKSLPKGVRREYLVSFRMTQNSRPIMVQSGGYSAVLMPMALD